MKIALTGATGLVGAHTTALLIAQGHAVRALVRSQGKLHTVLQPFGIDATQVEQIIGDVAEPASLDRLLDDCDAVIHAAGLFSDDYRDAQQMRRVNVAGTERVLEAAAARQMPVVYVSSYLALLPARGPLTRADDPVGFPNNLYARTKADAERIARSWQERGAPVTIVYPGAILGPDDPTYSTGPQMIARYLKQGAVLVTQGGLVYADVRDIAAVCVAALRVPGPNRYLYGGPYLAHASLLMLLRRLTGRDLKAQKIPGWILRAMGRINDGVAFIRKSPPELTFEAATVLTRTVPCEDQPTIDALSIHPTSAEKSFRDTLLWMYRAGHLTRDEIGKLAET